jgi:hypothetical protein
MATPAAPITIADIDVAITAAHWRYLHAVWQDDAMGEELALVQQNALLEQRFKLTRPAPAPLYPR